MKAIMCHRNDDCFKKRLLVLSVAWKYGFYSFYSSQMHYWLRIEGLLTSPRVRPISFGNLVLVGTAASSTEQHKTVALT